MFGKLMAKIGESLGLLKERSARLTSQRDAAKTSLEKAMAAVQAHLLEGDADDVKALGVLQSAVDRASSLLASLDAAIAEQTRRVADAERQLADEQTKAARKAASEALARDVEQIEQLIVPWLSTTRQLAAALAKHETFRFEAGSIAKYLANAAQEVEIALSVSIPDLRGGVIAVAEGREKPPVPPATVAKIVAPKAPVTETVFLLRHLKYTDAQGNVQCAGKMRDHALPPHFAQKALKSGAAVPLSDPRRKSLSGSWGMMAPSESQCESLDGTPSGTAAPITHSAFEPHPSRPNHGMMPEQRVAARSVPIEKPEN
jgi:hypothetical protein